MLWLTLVLGLAVAPAPVSRGDPVAPGERALLSLEYERALKLLSPVADDDELPRPVRARAFVLIAQAHFGIAGGNAEGKARAALRSALRLDRNVTLENPEDLSPKLVALFDELRAGLPKKAPAKDPPPSQETPKPPPPLDDDSDDSDDGSDESDDESSDDESSDGSGGATPEPPGNTDDAPLSPFFVGAFAAGGLAAVSAAVAAGCELWLGAVPPGTSADEVKTVQGAGAAAVVVAVAAAGVAGAAAVAGVVAQE